MTDGTLVRHGGVALPGNAGALSDPGGARRLRPLPCIDLTAPRAFWWQYASEKQKQPYILAAARKGLAEAALHAKKIE